MIMGLGSFSPVPHVIVSFASSPGPSFGLASSSDTASPSFLVISDIHLRAEDVQSPEITKNSD